MDAATRNPNSGMGMNIGHNYGGGAEVDNPRVVDMRRNGKNIAA